jgi:hypothetical protein
VYNFNFNLKLHAGLHAMRTRTRPWAHAHPHPKSKKHTSKYGITCDDEITLICSDSTQPQYKGGRAYPATAWVALQSGRFVKRGLPTHAANAVRTELTGGGAGGSSEGASAAAGAMITAQHLSGSDSTLSAAAAAPSTCSDWRYGAGVAASARGGQRRWKGACSICAINIAVCMRLKLPHSTCAARR